MVGGPYEVGSQFYACNRNKRVACFNLRTPEGLAAAKRLVATADVVVENLRGGALERLGLGYEALSAEHPRLVYASASGWGPKGPRATMASVDIIAQGAGGSVAHTGTPETGPLPTGVALADHAGAVFLALGIMFALYGRERTGRGQRVDTSLFGSQLGMQAWEFSHYLLDRGELPMGGKGHALARAVWHVFDAVRWVVRAGLGDGCAFRGAVRGDGLGRPGEGRALRVGAGTGRASRRVVRGDARWLPRVVVGGLAGALRGDGPGVLEGERVLGFGVAPAGAWRTTT